MKKDEHTYMESVHEEIADALGLQKGLIYWLRRSRPELPYISYVFITSA